MKHFANPAAFAYSMTTLGAAMMNSIFSFYYVKLFLNKYKISEGAFHQSQVSSGALGAYVCIFSYIKGVVVREKEIKLVFLVESQSCK